MYADIVSIAVSSLEISLSIAPKLRATFAARIVFMFCRPSKSVMDADRLYELLKVVTLV